MLCQTCTKGFRFFFFSSYSFYIFVAGTFTIQCRSNCSSIKKSGVKNQVSQTNYQKHFTRDVMNQIRVMLQDLQGCVKDRCISHSILEVAIKGGMLSLLYFNFSFTSVHVLHCSGQLPIPVFDNALPCLDFNWA